MAGLRRIGDSADTTILITQAGSTLHMHEENIDLRLRPGDFEATALEKPLIDGAAVRIGSDAALLQTAESIGLVEPGGAIGVIEIDQIVRTPVERKTENIVRPVRHVDIRFVEGGDEAGIAVLAANQKGPTVRLEKGARRFRR